VYWIARVKMAEASGVVELEDEEVLQLIEAGEDKEQPEYLVSCISHSLMDAVKISNIE
jgi:hypothetical protein